MPNVNIICLRSQIIREKQYIKITGSKALHNVGSRCKLNDVMVCALTSCICGLARFIAVHGLGTRVKRCKQTERDGLHNKFWHGLCLRSSKRQQQETALTESICMNVITRKSDHKFKVQLLGVCLLFNLGNKLSCCHGRHKRFLQLNNTSD